MTASATLRVALVCPYCGRAIRASLPVQFSVGKKTKFVIGDSFEWKKGAADEKDVAPYVQIHQRDVSSTCPKCRRKFPASIIIHGDRFHEVLLDFSRFDLPRPNGAKLRRPAGKVKFGDTWELSPRRCAAIVRLAELGIDLYSTGRASFSLFVPWKIDDISLVEIGFLMAQLGDDDFPAGYETFIVGDSARKYPRRKDGSHALYFSESFPQGVRYRVEYQVKQKKSRKTRPV